MRQALLNRPSNSSIVDTFTGDHKLNTFKVKQKTNTMKLSDYLIKGNDDKRAM